ncbi:MAG TPA: D-alanyl-D-alanine carboxypeptidase/D-alanyl-D-alanine-endopeptidase [Paracoccaceae bacterium]|nr:D-alanyl-D-alanine carboxypeptidase/D-alanyl-D-alanine-endopeptidase [Paracoccaceae bacterium]
MARLSRRSFLAGLAAFAPLIARAGAPDVAAPPRVRPARVWRAVPAALDERLSGRSGFAVMDLATGAILEAHAADAPFLPASVAKLPTALYALETLGQQHRFATRLLATGPVAGGTLQGDLVLVGGGDPVLDTDGLGDLAEMALGLGIRRVAGRLIVDGTLLPLLPQIDPTQPVHVAYNPAVAGLNLNFNRVFLEWRRQAGGHDLRLEARAVRFSPPVHCIQISPAPRAAPLFTWEVRQGREHWTVSEPALGPKGGRWLPVRDPIAYAGEVFRAVAALRGLELPVPQPGRAGAGAEIAIAESPPLGQILQDMLKHSTNLTAEVLGLQAARARGIAAGTLAGSGAAMADWVRAYAGLQGGLAIVNHSGLSAETQMTPRQTVALLAAAERRAPGRLKAMLKAVPLEAERGERPLPEPAHVAAKTGTLNFVRGLAGYLEGPNGRPLAFAIYAADVTARERAGSTDLERPAGSRSWIGRARAQERALLRSWLSRFGAA